MQVARKLLKEDGKFILIDGHPVAEMFEWRDEGLVLDCSYFHADIPYEYHEEKAYEWNHDQDSLYAAVGENDLRVETFNE